MSWNRERKEAICSTVDNIRKIENEYGVTKSGLNEILGQLQKLATHVEWFSEDEFPAPDFDIAESSYVYRISEDPNDHRFALYVQSARAPTSTPPHNHDTWAVIAGINGNELNRFYRETEEGVEVVGSHVVQAGTGVTLLPDDLHSIHITDEGCVINFHMYGLGLEYLTERQYFDRKSGEWKIFARYDNIIDARHILQ